MSAEINDIHHWVFKILGKKQSVTAGHKDGHMDGRSYEWTFVGYYSVNFSAQNTQQDA